MPQAPSAQSDLQQDYAALNERCAVVDRSYRGLLEVRGKDRASWLHNLVTNQVKPLGTGDGVYAFALNVQGRILFDLDLLVMRESIWLDIDRTFVPTAKRHLERYHIVEDVQVVDRSDEFVRVGLVGQTAKAVVAELGAPQAAKMPALGITTASWRNTELTTASWRNIELTVVRHDFCGPFGCDLFVPAAAGSDFRQALVEGSAGSRASEAFSPSEPRHSWRAAPVSGEAVEVRRIEAGIPWPGREITEEYLPAETDQMARAVSNQKGCYLGQEIVERMRARGALARRLGGLMFEGDAVPPIGAQVLDNAGKTIGAVTSACRSLALNRPIALAYLKTATASPGTPVQAAWDGGIESATVAALPFISPAAG